MNRAEILAGAMGEMRVASTAGGGTALSTTATYIALPANTRHVAITPRNFVTAVVAQILFNPYLVVLRTFDSLANVQDYSNVAQDGDATTEVVLDAQDTAANGDYLYVGSHLPFAGVYVDVSADASEANGTGSVLTVNYWDGKAWTSISATDGTTSGGASLAVDGAVTWTVPSAWKAETLERIDLPPAGSSIELRGTPLYWTRWQWSVQLDVLVRLDAMLAINRGTVYAELLSGQTYERAVQRGVGGLGCVQAKTDAGTANLVMNVATSDGSHF